MIIVMHVYIQSQHVLISVTGVALYYWSKIQTTNESKQPMNGITVSGSDGIDALN